MCSDWKAPLCHIYLLHTLIALELGIELIKGQLSAPKPKWAPNLSVVLFSRELTRLEALARSLGYQGRVFNSLTHCVPWIGWLDGFCCDAVSARLSCSNTTRQPTAYRKDMQLGGEKPKPCACYLLPSLVFKGWSLRSSLMYLRCHALQRHTYGTDVLHQPAGGSDGRRTGRTRKVGQRMAVVSEAERTQAATARLAALEDDDFAAVADAGADNSDDEFVVDLGGSEDGARPACALPSAACVVKVTSDISTSDGVLLPANPARRTWRRQRKGAQFWPLAARVGGAARLDVHRTLSANLRSHTPRRAGAGGVSVEEAPEEPRRRRRRRARAQAQDARDAGGGAPRPAHVRGAAGGGGGGGAGAGGPAAAGIPRRCRGPAGVVISCVSWSASLGTCGCASSIRALVNLCNKADFPSSA